MSLTIGFATPDRLWASDLETVPQNFIKTQFGYHLIWVHSITLPE